MIHRAAAPEAVLGLLERTFLVVPVQRHRAGVLLGEQPRDGHIALSILRDVADSLAEARYTGGRPTQVSVYIAPASSGGETALAEG
ncbi:hypothetical protein OHA57_00465 [Streptomyces anulatus]|uniref:hypothetical protein n=1 Tax=Streptomyces anulatus TaxID=1892 RepID=UPI002DDBF574|nr:hypothetical protein [Streptomyces anulatus]WSC59293.1 hypothetical protein OHA57_00465 [Streptomyces anulatus]